MWANFNAILAMTGFQKFYLINTGKNDRYLVHRNALFFRYISNMSYLTQNKSKPIIH